MAEIVPVYHHFFTITNLSIASKKKSKFLNTFFAKQYSLIDNDGTLPTDK